MQGAPYNIQFKSRFLLRLLALCILVFSSSLCAKQVPVDLASILSGSEISTSLEYLEDNTQALGISDVRSEAWSGKFIALAGLRQFSRTNSAYWFRLRLRNSGLYPLEKLLIVRYPSHQQLSYFEVDDGRGEVRALHRDARALINEVDIRHRLPVYTATVGAGNTKTIFLRVVSPTIRTNIEVWEAKDFLAEGRFSEWWFLVFLGVILAATIYSAVIAVATRSPLYTSLFSVTIMMLCVQITLHGHEYQILGGAGGAFNYAWLLIQTWTCATVLVFSYIFLNGASMSRVFRYGMIALTVAFMLTGLVSLLDYHGALLAARPLLSLGPLFLLFAVIHQVRRKNRDAVLYLVAWLPLLLLTVLIGLNGFGLFGFAGLGTAIVAAWIPTTIIVFGFCVVFRTRAEHRESMGKSTFLAVLSHEVRTPLTGILGTVSLLGNSPLNVRQRRLVDNLRSSGNALLALLDEVLQLSRFEAGRAIELDLAPADPSELARSMVELMSARAQAKGIAIDFTTSGAIPGAVLVDEARLRQVLLNLISNALKFTDEGRVCVAITAGEPLNGKISLRFSVTDDGIGIAPDKLSTLFEPYVQADSRNREGTGLGLFISQQLVELMGGSVNVASEVGSGSCFSFAIEADIAAFPLAAPLTQREVVKVPAETNVQGERLLLVDDVALNREVIGELLRNAGFSVTTAESGVEALERFDPGKFDAVVLDVFMPGISGMEVAEQLRAKGETCPLLGLSAAAEPALISACLASGMDRVLRKPADIELLVVTILELIRQSGRNSDRPILNSSMLDALRDAIGASRCAELCGEAEASLGEHLDGLEEAFGREDASSAGQIAHMLAGVASSVGLERLGHTAEQLSASLRGGESDQFRAAQIDGLRAITHESLVTLQTARNAPVS